MKTPIKSISLLALLLFTSPVLAQEAPAPEQEKSPSVLECKEQKWGIGFGVRMASIPFKGDDSTLHDLIPLFYYEDEHLYLDGLEGGLKLLDREEWKLRLLARWRFFDVPDDDYDALIDTDVLDWGLQLRYQPSQSPLYFEVDFMADERQRISSNLRSGLDFEHGPVSWSPYVNLRAKDSRFNDYYYGFGVEDVGSGVDVSVGVEAKYHLFDEIFLVGSVEGTWLDSNAQDSFYVEDDYQGNVFLAGAARLQAAYCSVCHLAIPHF